MSSVHHAPPEPTSFVGRRQELDAVGATLASGRVLTLVGPGGAGKTRLAARAALEQSARWSDGAWWVDLASATTEADVVDAVAGALDLASATTEADVVDAVAGALDLAVASLDAVASLGHALAGRGVLVVLDNCEQVAAAVAGMVDTVISIAPEVGVLVTSRTPLGSSAEHVWRVPPLALADALTLFLDRAEARGTTTAASAGARRICDRLDRLPLALELVAGWTGTLTTEQIAASLAEPLPLLEDGPGTAPYRQRSLAASVQWSHDLLDEDERLVFRRLSVLRRWFTADQAIGVCADADLGTYRVLHALRRLVDSSLVVADTGGEAARYALLEVIHAFARERLAEAGEEEIIRDRHLEVFRAVLEQLEPLLATDKDTWRERERAEHDNLIAALEWGLARADSTAGRQLAAGLAWRWHFGSSGGEGLRLLATAVERGADERSALQARALVGLALVADVALPGAEAYRHAEAALEMAEAVGDAPTARLARSLIAIGAIAHDLDASRRLADQARGEALAAGEAFVADGSAVLLGILHHLRDEHDEATALLEPAAHGLLSRGDRGVATTALSHHALTLALTGRLAEAEACAARAVEAARPLHDLHRLGLATAVLAETRALQGRLAEAMETVAPIQDLLDGINQVTFVPGWERTMARLALWGGRPADAVEWCRREVRWLGETAADERLTTETQALLAVALRLAGDPVRAASVLDAAAQVADRLALPRVRATVADERGHLHPDLDTANDAHHEALAVRAEHGLAIGCVDSMEALAEVGLRRGTPELSAMLLGAADQLRVTTGYAARLAPEAEEVRALAGDPAYFSAWERGRSLGLDAVAHARRMRGPRGRPDRGWASLTPAEATVVELAVEGLSNPQIAERLYVSRGTVKTHLAHVYAKLGVANRTELAAAQARRDPGQQGP